jgi:hypothetical protein
MLWYLVVSDGDVLRAGTAAAQSSFSNASHSGSIARRDVLLIILQAPTNKHKIKHNIANSMWATVSCHSHAARFAQQS